MSDTPTMWNTRRVRELAILLGILTIASAVWPVYRAFLIPDINFNEPWNAYFADEAIRGEKLYPSRDQFITNNYPPLSFYVVGAAGQALGDTILAGRLLSLASIAWIALGFALCHIAYGPDFWGNMRTPRSYEFRLVVDSLATLQWPIVGVVVWLCLGITLRKLPAVKFCNVWVLVSVLVFLLQKASEGVAENAMFDLMIALSVAMGIAFSHAADVPLAKKVPATRLQAGVLIAIAIRLLTVPGNETVRLVFDPSFREEIRLRELAMRESVARVKETPGDVLTAAVVSYRAGKPFIVDMFNFQQRAKAGHFPATILDDLVKAGKFTHVQADPRHAWCNPMD